MPRTEHAHRPACFLRKKIRARSADENADTTRTSEVRRSVRTVTLARRPDIEPHRDSGRRMLDFRRRVPQIRQRIDDLFTTLPVRTLTARTEAWVHRRRTSSAGTVLIVGKSASGRNELGLRFVADQIGISATDQECPQAEKHAKYFPHCESPFNGLRKITDKTRILPEEAGVNAAECQFANAFRAPRFLDTKRNIY